jgi:gliding motility-associated protein GldL
LVSSYQDIAASIGSASQGSKNFASQIDGINKNISTINSVFELQVKSVNEQNEAMKTLASAVKTIEASLNGSAAEAEEYKKQVGILATQLKNLNSVYGNMLNAMTIRG